MHRWDHDECTCEGNAAARLIRVLRQFAAVMNPVEFSEILARAIAEALRHHRHHHEDHDDECHEDEHHEDEHHDEDDERHEKHKRRRHHHDEDHDEDDHHEDEDEEREDHDDEDHEEHHGKRRIRLGKRFGRI